MNPGGDGYRPAAFSSVFHVGRFLGPSYTSKRAPLDGVQLRCSALASRKNDARSRKFYTAWRGDEPVHRLHETRNLLTGLKYVVWQEH